MKWNESVVRHLAARTHEQCMRDVQSGRGLFGLSLCGMCAIGAARLFTRLQRLGLDVSLALAEDEECSVGHCFVVCEGHIVDVTATQFDKRPVEILELAEAPLEAWFWQPVRLFGSVTELARYLDEDGWPENQVPFAEAREAALVAS